MATYTQTMGRRIVERMTVRHGVAVIRRYDEHGNEIGKSTMSAGDGRVSQFIYHADSKRNPRSTTTLRNMASVTIRKLPNGVVKITGRKMAGGSRRNVSWPREYWYEVFQYGESTNKTYTSKRAADEAARKLNREDPKSARVRRISPRD